MSILTEKIKVQFNDNHELLEMFEKSFFNAYKSKVNDVRRMNLSNKTFGMKKFNEYFHEDIIHSILENYSNIELKKTYRNYESFSPKDYNDVIPFTLNNMSSYFKLKVNTCDIMVLKEECKNYFNAFKSNLNNIPKFTHNELKEIFYSMVAPQIYKSDIENISMKEIGVKESVRHLISDDMFIYLLEEYNEIDDELLGDKILDSTKNVISNLTFEDIRMMFYNIIKTINNYFTENKIKIIFPNDITDFETLFKYIISHKKLKPVYDYNNNIIISYITLSDEFLQNQIEELCVTASNHYFYIISKVLNDFESFLLNFGIKQSVKFEDINILALQKHFQKFFIDIK